MFPGAGPNFDMADTLAGWTGSSGNFIKQMTGPLGFPAVAPSGYSAMGTGTQPWSNEAGNAYQWAGSVTKVCGAHTLKAGLGLSDFSNTPSPNGFIASGSYAFSQSFTQGRNPTAAGPLIGNGVASMLTGLGTGSAQSYPVSTLLATIMRRISRMTITSQRNWCSIRLRWDLGNWPYRSV